MTIAYSFCCLLWFPLVLYASAAPRGLQEGVMAKGRAGNPGMAVRVTQSGVDYVERLAIKAMQDQFPKVRIKDVRADIREGYIHMTNMRITRFTPPKKHAVILEPPDTVRWTISDADVSIHGDFSGKQRVLLSNVPVSGYFDADTTGVDFSISFSLYKADDASLAVKSRQCTADVKELTANVHVRLTSAGAALASLFKNSVINQMRPIVAAEMCKQAERFIDEELNKQLSTIPKKLPLNQTTYDLKHAKKDVKDSRVSADDEKRNRGTGPSRPRPESSNKNTNKSTSSFKTITDNLVKHLVLDYTITNDPVVTSKYIESFGKGEVSYEGQGGTPFYPPQLMEPKPLPTDRMIYVTASDYALNSFFWHAYKHGLLKFYADGRQFPDYKSVLRTSCDNDVFAICLGNMVPEVGNSFPNSEVEIVFQLVKSPAVYFQRDGKVKLVAPSYVTAYARKNNDLKEMLTADLHVESEMRAWIDELKLKSNGTIKKFNMTMRNNNLKQFNQEKLNEFANMARAMFQELFNNELEKGLQLPTIDGASFLRPVLRIFERTLRVESDVTIDESVLTLLAIEALRNGNSKVTIEES